MTTRATTTATTTNPQFSPATGRPDPGAAGAYLGDLFAAHGRMVLGLCRLLLRDPVEAEDAAQQSFLSAHRAVLGGVTPREPAAWLAAIARNECRARIRTRMREPLGLPELPDDLPDPLASAIRNADLAALWTALSELPRRQRRAFLLRELGGFSYGELGLALGVTRPAVESLLFRARQRLRESLAGANLALVPVALRDQLAQLIPGFGAAAPAAALPIAAKVAAVTASVGLVAAGAAEVPRRPAVHHARVPAAPVLAVRPERRAAIRTLQQLAVSTPATLPHVAPRGAEQEREPAETKQHAREAETEHRDTQVAHETSDEGRSGSSDGVEEHSGGDGSDSSDSGD